MTPRPRRGLALIEVVTATFLLTGALLAALSVQTSAAQLQASARRQLDAIAEAQGLHDSLLALPCARIGNGSHRTTKAHYQWRVSTVATVKQLEFDVAPAVRYGRPWNTLTAVSCQ